MKITHCKCTLQYLMVPLEGCNPFKFTHIFATTGLSHALALSNKV